MPKKEVIVKKAALFFFLAGILLIPLTVWNGTLTAVHVKYLLARCIIVVVTLLLLLRVHFSGKISVPSDPLLLAGLPFVAYCYVVCKVNPFTDWMVFGDLCLSLLLFYSAVQLFGDKQFLRTTLLLWQVAAIPVGLVHLAELAGFQSGWAVPGFEGTTFANRNAMAWYLLCGYPFALYLICSSKGKVRLLSTVSLVVTLTTLLLSSGRAAKMIILLMLPVLFYYIGRRDNRLKVRRVFLLVALITAALVIGGIAASVITACNMSFDQLNAFSHYRLQIWKETLPLVSGNVWFGQGAGIFPRLFPAFRSAKIGLLFGLNDPVFNSHNECLELVIEYGIVGLVLFTVFIVAVTGIRNVDLLKSTRDRDLLFFSAYSLAGSFLLSQLVSISHFLYCSYFTWISLAVYYVAREMKYAVVHINGRKVKSIVALGLMALSVVSILFLGAFAKLFVADVYTRKASRVIEAGGSDELASEQISKALFLKPGYIYALYQRAFLAMAVGDERKAMKDYRAIQSVDPYFENIHYNIGIIYYRQRNYAEAIKALSISVRLFPTLPDGIYYLAKSYYGAGRLKESLHWADLLFKIHPEKEAYRNLYEFVFREAGGRLEK